MSASAPKEHKRLGCGVHPGANIAWSYRRSDYASAQHQALLAKHGLVGNMSRKGNYWDNAAIERFFLGQKIAQVGRPVDYWTLPSLTDLENLLSTL